MMKWCAVSVTSISTPASLAYWLRRLASVRARSVYCLKPIHVPKTSVGTLILATFVAQVGAREFGHRVGDGGAVGCQTPRHDAIEVRLLFHHVPRADARI